MPELKDKTCRCDAFLGGRLELWQPRKGFRAGLDSVVMAAAVPVCAGEQVMDLGCGVGTAALCVLARVPRARAYGLELQEVLHRLACENARYNGFEDRFFPKQGDILDPPRDRAAFDHVIFNPPFFSSAESRPSDHPIRRLAHHEGPAGLADWIAAGMQRLRHKGTLTLIHRSDRLGEILSILHDRGAGDIQICPLWPAVGRPAKRILIRARRGVKTPMTLHPGVVLHHTNGDYSPDIQAVVAGGAALAF